MAGRPLRPATRQRLGRPLPHQQADRTRPHPMPQKAFPTLACAHVEHPALPPVSRSYSGAWGRSVTHYSPVRHSHQPSKARPDPVRLACVKHAASVHPEPESNPPQKTFMKSQTAPIEKDGPSNKEGRAHKTPDTHQTPSGTTRAGIGLAIKNHKPHPHGCDPWQVVQYTLLSSQTTKHSRRTHREPTPAARQPAAR